MAKDAQQAVDQSIILRKVNELILEGYLGECALDAVNNKSAAKRKEAVKELVKIYTKK
jgi:DNA-binding FrmR family transcriptional regulator